MWVYFTYPNNLFKSMNSIFNVIEIFISSEFLYLTLKCTL